MEAALARSTTLAEFSCDDITAVAYRGLKDDLRWKVHSGSDEIELPMQRITGLSPLLTRKNRLEERAGLLKELYEVKVLRKPWRLNFEEKSGMRPRLISWLKQHDFMALQLFRFCDLKGWELTRVSEYDDNPPQQKPIKKPGLHLIGTCKTNDCWLKGREAWSCQEFGLISLSKTDLCKALCPGTCKQPLSAVHSFALHACRFQFRGRSPETEIPQELEEGMVLAGEVIMSKGEPSEWNYLEVRVSPLKG